jgi:hypothetical protein
MQHKEKQLFNVQDIFIFLSSKKLVVFTYFNRYLFNTFFSNLESNKTSIGKTLESFHKPKYFKQKI